MTEMSQAVHADIECSVELDQEQHYRIGAYGMLAQLL
jgi:hypothetical protein